MLNIPWCTTLGEQINYFRSENYIGVLSEIQFRIGMYLPVIPT